MQQRNLIKVQVVLKMVGVGFRRIFSFPSYSHKLWHTLVGTAIFGKEMKEKNNGLAASFEVIVLSVL